ncbi:MAG: FG-GAP-like repeat-containing protein [Desulfobacteraceae bacterium]
MFIYRKKRRSMVAYLWIILAIFALSSCSNGSHSEHPVDPSKSYKGETGKATVSSENAGELAMGGFGGGDIANIVTSAAKSDHKDSNDTLNTSKNLPVRQFTQIIKQSIRRMQIAQKARKIKAVKRKEEFDLYGDNGGTATYNLDVNDSTGSFKGTINYNQFASQSVVINGIANIIGTVDPNWNDVTQLTLSFKSLDLNFGNPEGWTLTGRLSLNTDFSSHTETLSMDLVLLDQDDDKTYWFNNYTITTHFLDNGASQTMTGRYYDHDNGYVELTTPVSLYFNYNSGWPSEGSVLFNGDSGTWVQLNFNGNIISIEADTNGDGGIDWQDETEIDDPDPENNRPTANAGPDQNVTIGSTVILNGNASTDPEDDPLSYSWSMDSYPNGTYPSLSSYYSATPNFTPAVTGTYVFSLYVFDGFSYSQTDTITVVVAPVTPLYPSSVKQKWHHGIFGTSIGRAGLITTDLDNDGVPEIIASASLGGYGSDSTWYVLKRDGSGGYDQVWRSPLYNSTLVSLSHADINGDGHEDFVAGLANGVVHIYHGVTMVEIRSFTVSNQLNNLVVCDLDGDGEKETVASNGSGISVHNIDDGSLKWSVASYGGSTMAVGNVDTDATLEIVTSAYGGNGYVLDGISGTVQWTYINSFGAIVRLGDLDGDNMDEIIGASPWSNITVFDADVKTPAWEITSSHDIGALEIFDTDHDGIPEILYCDNQWGSVHAVDIQSKTDKWYVHNPEYGVSGIAMGDVDHDGELEILWGSDFLFIANPQTNVIEWKNNDLYGVSPVAVDDIDGDGLVEFLMVSFSSNSGYDSGIIQIFNALDHNVELQAVLQSSDWNGDRRVIRTGDVDGDGKKEIVLITANYYDGFIQIYDGETLALERQSAIDNDDSFTTMAIGDVDNDGKVEIVAGSGQAYLVVYDGSTLEEEWRSVNMGSSWDSIIYDIKITDLDKDSHPDIVATITENRLIVYDGVTHVLKLLQQCPAMALDVADVDSDGFPEILVGRSDGMIDIYDGVTFDVENSVSTFTYGSVQALRVADLDGQGAAEWLIANGGMLSILQGQGDGSGLIWRSEYLGSNPGYRNHIAVNDIDNNGFPDIFIGSYTENYQFEFVGIDK